MVSCLASCSRTTTHHVLRRVLEMAEEFPHVRFDGLDIGELLSLQHLPCVIAYMGPVPIATRYPPVNVLFEMHDINQPLRYRDEHYDLVHARSISLAVSWFHPCVLCTASRALPPPLLPSHRFATTVLLLTKSHASSDLEDSSLRASGADTLQ